MTYYHYVSSGTLNSTNATQLSLAITLVGRYRHKSKGTRAKLAWKRSQIISSMAEYWGDIPYRIHFTKQSLRTRPSPSFVPFISGHRHSHHDDWTPNFYTLETGTVFVYLQTFRTHYHQAGWKCTDFFVCFHFFREVLPQTPFIEVTFIGSGGIYRTPNKHLQSSSLICKK